jgi:hypothetical protein
MAAKTAPGIETVERLFDEVDEWYQRVHEVRRRLAKLERGGEDYLDLLSDLWVEADVLSRKATQAAEALDEFQESLRDSD